jgi:hypothetical protein
MLVQVHECGRPFDAHGGVDLDGIDVSLYGMLFAVPWFVIGVVVFPFAPC